MTRFVEPWVKEHPRTLRRCIGIKVSPRDLTDDRLATILDYLCVAERWGACERALTASVLRVYDLRGRVVRVDTTTAAAYVTPAGMFQLGHSKDHRPDLPQVKIAMAVLDPLGLPLTTTVVAGNTADDPLYPTFKGYWQRVMIFRFEIVLKAPQTSSFGQKCLS